MKWERFEKVADRCTGLVGGYSYGDEGEPNEGQCLVSWLENPDDSDWEEEEVFGSEQEAIDAIIDRLKVF